MDRERSRGLSPESFGTARRALVKARLVFDALSGYLRRSNVGYDAVMPTMRSRSLFLAHFVLLVIALCARAAAQTPAPSPAASATPSPLQIHVTPYLWLPTVNASLRFERGDIQLPSGAPPPALANSVNVTFGPNKYLTNLNSAFMFTADVRKGNGSIFTDVIYLNLSSSKSSVASLTSPDGSIVVPVNASTSGRLRSTVWTLALSTSPFATSNPPPLEGFVGFRNLTVSTHADWTLTGSLGQLSPTGSAQKTVTEFVPLAGIKGRLTLGPHWFVPYYGDYGANAGVESWQGVLGVAYGYHSGAAQLVWRQLNYASGSRALESLRFGGPAVGWTFNL